MQDARRKNGFAKEDVATEGSGPLCTQLKENGALLVLQSIAAFAVHVLQELGVQLTSGNELPPPEMWYSGPLIYTIRRLYN